MHVIDTNRMQYLSLSNELNIQTQFKAFTNKQVALISYFHSTLKR